MQFLVCLLQFLHGIFYESMPRHEGRSVQAANNVDMHAACRHGISVSCRRCERALSEVVEISANEAAGSPPGRHICRLVTKQCNRMAGSGFESVTQGCAGLIETIRRRCRRELIEWHARLTCRRSSVPYKTRPRRDRGRGRNRFACSHRMAGSHRASYGC